MHEPFKSGAALAVFETLDSTSREALRRAEAGARGPLWVVALDQTSGYGRRGAAWQSGPGDFAGTFLFDPQAAAPRLGEISFLAALAVAGAIGEIAPAARLALKWPNDILISNAKLAGILIELIEAPGGPLLAVGIGVNVVSRPEGVDYPTARLLDVVGEAPAPADLARRIDAHFDARLAAWRLHGFEPARLDWLALASGLGRSVRVRLPNETVEGTFIDLDPSGALVLDCDGERRRIAAGAILRS